MADQLADLAHLNARDTTFAFASRAPQAEIQGLKQRMGWDVPVVHDHGRLRRRPRRRRVARHQRLPARAADDVFRTYFIHDRGDEALGTTWSHLDMTAFGRQEEWEDSPEGTPQSDAVHVVELPRQVRGARRDRARGRSAGRGAAGAEPWACWPSPAPGWPCTCGAPGRRDGGPDAEHERTFDAPRQRVFEAWTSAEVMKRWWHAGHDWETTEASVDLRVGGAVRVVMRNPHEDAEYGGGGEYTEIDPPRRLAFTWEWDDERDQRSQVIEIDFVARGGRPDHGPFHPPRPLGRGGRARPRGRLGQGLRQLERDHAAKSGVVERGPLTGRRDRCLSSLQRHGPRRKERGHEL